MSRGIFLPHHFLPASKSTAFFFSRRRYLTPANPTAQAVNTSKASETPRAIALNEYEFWSNSSWYPFVTLVPAKSFIGVFERWKTKDYEITHLRRNYFINDTFVGQQKIQTCG